MDGERQLESIVERFVNLEDVAEHLALSKDAIRNFIKKDGIPYYRVGKQYKFRISEINAWVESGKAAKTTSESREEV